MKISKIKISVLLTLGLFFWNNHFGFIQADLIAEAATKDAVMLLTPETQTVKPGQGFEVKVIIDNNASKQGIVTAGFDLEYPTSLLEVVDADNTTAGVQIKTEGNDFSINDPSMNSVSAGKISFTTGTKGQSPITKNEVIVATIPFKAKAGLKTQTVALNFLATSTNNGAFINGNNNNPENILKDGTAGLKGASIVISNVGFSLSPATKQLKKGDNFNVDIVISNPDEKSIVTLAFELIYDKERVKPKNTDNKILIAVDDSKNMQIVENDIKTTSGSIVFTGGFTGNKLKDKTLTIGSLTFEALKDGTANLRFNQNINSSSVYLENDAANNYLANFSDGKYTVGEVSTDGSVVTATPRGGTYAQAQTVTLESSDEDSEIYFTIDGNVPTIDSTRYNSPILLNTTTTLKFFGVDQDGNEGTVSTEIYQISSGGSFAIGITSVKNELDLGERTSIIIKVVDNSISRAVPGKTILLSNSGSGKLEVNSGLVTDDEGEILIDYIASNEVGSDVITAKLSDNPNIQGHLNLTIKSSDIAKITLVGSNLSSQKDNIISATIENSAGQKTSAVLPVELKVANKGTAESKTYLTDISNGIATFAIPGIDLTANTSYILTASVNGIFSNELELSTESNNNSVAGTKLRPGGGQPGTGPRENLIFLILISTAGVFFYQHRKQQNN